jgi:hypothetical protein
VPLTALSNHSQLWWNLSINHRDFVECYLALPALHSGARNALAKAHHPKEPNISKTHVSNANVLQFQWRCDRPKRLNFLMLRTGTSWPHPSPPCSGSSVSHSRYLHRHRRSSLPLLAIPQTQHDRVLRIDPSVERIRDLVERKEDRSSVLDERKIVSARRWLDKDRRQRVWRQERVISSCLRPKEVRRESQDPERSVSQRCRARCRHSGRGFLWW